MKMTTSTLILVLAVATGCGENGRKDAHDAGAVPAGGGGGNETEQGTAGALLRIDAGMLRDLRLTTAPAEARGGGEQVVALGEVRVNEDAYAEVGSPISARVTRLLVSPGDPVRAGDPLAELESTELGRARADQREARARVDLAKQALDRKRELGAERIVPRREIQQAEAEAETAEAGLRAARARLRAMGVPADDDAAQGDEEISRFMVRSPITGTVIERGAVLGGATDPARPLFRIAEMSRLWLIVQVFERDAVRVSRGAVARVLFAALPGRTFTGTVARVAAQVDSAARTIPVRIDVANASGLIRPGMSATASIPLGDEGARLVAVPAASMQRLEGGWCVFIPKGEGEFEIRPVGRGRDLGGEVEVLTGLSAGEIVVVEGGFLLKAQADKTRDGGEEHDH